LLGADLYVLSGMAVDRGLYTITFWEGPDATGATQEALLFLVESLRLPHAAPPLPGREYQDPDHHYTIEIPDGWERAVEPLTPRISSLVEIFSAGTYPLRPGGGSCDPFPVNAVDDLGPEDSLVWIAEVSPGEGFPPRPDTFAGHDATQHVGEQFCLPVSARAFRQWIFPFTQGGRSFYLYVGVGDRITAARRAEAWRLADSFDPEPATSITPSPTGTTGR
jgi:hypothetical protein